MSVVVRTLIGHVFIFINIVAALVSGLQDNYAAAAYFMSNAIFLELVTS